MNIPLEPPSDQSDPLHEPGGAAADSAQRDLFEFLSAPLSEASGEYPAWRFLDWRDEMRHDEPTCNEVPQEEPTPSDEVAAADPGEQTTGAAVAPLDETSKANLRRLEETVSWLQSEAGRLPPAAPLPPVPGLPAQESIIDRTKPDRTLQRPPTLPIWLQEHQTQPQPPPLRERGVLWPRAVKFAMACAIAAPLSYYFAVLTSPLHKQLAEGTELASLETPAVSPPPAQRPAEERDASRESMAGPESAPAQQGALAPEPTRRAADIASCDDRGCRRQGEVLSADGRAGFGGRGHYRRRPLGGPTSPPRAGATTVAAMQQSPAPAAAPPPPPSPSRSLATLPSSPAATDFPSLSAATNIAATRGITDREIVFGVSAPFSGSAKELGRQMKMGIETAFNLANDTGGIHGRQLRLVAADDGYEPARTAETMKQLYEKDQVFGIVGNVGTPTAVVAVPYALEHRMLFFGAFTGANLLRRDPPDRYVFNYRASYAEETDAVVRYLVKIRRLRPEQIAVFAQQDSYGDAGFEGVAKALRSLRPPATTRPSCASTTSATPSTWTMRSHSCASTAAPSRPWSWWRPTGPRPSSSRRPTISSPDWSTPTSPSWAAPHWLKS